jgi:hypothetical protein
VFFFHLFPKNNFISFGFFFFAMASVQVDHYTLFLKAVTERCGYAETVSGQKRKPSSSWTSVSVPEPSGLVGAMASFSFERPAKKPKCSEPQWYPSSSDAVPSTTVHRNGKRKLDEIGTADRNEFGAKQGKKHIRGGGNATDRLPQAPQEKKKGTAPSQQDHKEAGERTGVEVDRPEPRSRRNQQRQQDDRPSQQDNHCPVNQQLHEFVYARSEQYRKLFSLDTVLAYKFLGVFQELQLEWGFHNEGATVSALDRRDGGCMSYIS